MQKYPGGAYEEHSYAEEVVEEFAFNNDYHYKGSSGQMKPGGHSNPYPRHNYSNHNNHGYEYDNYGNNFKEGRDGYSVQYEAKYEKEQYTEYPGHGGKHHSDYPRHGGKHQNGYRYQGNVPQFHGIGGTDGGYRGGGYGGHHGAVGGTDGGYRVGGYGGHHGAQQQRCYGEEKPFWNYKAIED